MTRRAHRSTRTDPLFPYTTLFRSGRVTGFYGSMANGSNMLDFIHPEDHVAALDAFDRGVLRGDPVDPLVLCIRMADDEWHHMEASVAGAVALEHGGGGRVVSLRDVSDRTRREAEASSHRRRLESPVVSGGAVWKGRWGKLG